MRSGWPVLLCIVSTSVFFPAHTPACAQSSPHPTLAALDSARRTRDESQLNLLKTQLNQRIAEYPKDAQATYYLALVKAYLVDPVEFRKDKKSASAQLDDAISTVQHAIELDEHSSDAHSLLADLLGRKIGYGGMFAGPKLGPKVKEENKRALALDDRNPRAWASLGRQYLMAPAMFGGDVSKAIESFQKSLALDPQQDETWVWLAQAFKKKGDKPKAHDALDKALQLNPQSPLARNVAASLSQ